MEQEVASHLEKLGFSVQTNRAFRDPDEGKSREIDVWAHRNVVYDEEHKLSVTLELLCECKNMRTPLVFLGRPKNEADRTLVPREQFFPISTYDEVTFDEGRARVIKHETFFHLGLDKFHPFYLQEDKAVQFTKIIRDRDRWQANHAGAYDSIIIPLAKALRWRLKDIPLPQQAGGWTYVGLVFPVVVVSGLLFYVDATAEQIRPEEVPSVSFRREIQSGSLSGDFIIDFVRQERLEDFLTQKIFPYVAEVRRIGTVAPQCLTERQSRRPPPPQR